MKGLTLEHRKNKRMARGYTEQVKIAISKGDVKLARWLAMFAAERHHAYLLHRI